MGRNTNSTAMPSAGLNGAPGAPGTNGINGKNAVNIIISNEAYILSSANDGTVLSYVGSGTTIKVYDGDTLIPYDGTGTSNNTWKATSVGTNITIGTLTDSGSYLTVGDHSAVAAGTDNSKIVYTISGVRPNGDSFTIVKEQNFSKSKIGATGATGTIKAQVLLHQTSTVGSNTYSTGSTLIASAASKLALGSLLVDGDYIVIDCILTKSVSSMASVISLAFGSIAAQSNIFYWGAVAGDTKALIQIKITRLSDTTVSVLTTNSKGSVTTFSTGYAVSSLTSNDNAIILKADASYSAGTISLSDLSITIYKQ